MALPVNRPCRSAGPSADRGDGQAALERFLYGRPYADLLAHGPRLPLNTAWRRLLHRTRAVDAVRDACGGWAPAAEAPETEQTIAALVPGSGPNAGTVVDVVAAVGATLTDARRRDESFARYDDRWVGGCGALRDLVPADIGAVRSRLTPPGVLLAYHGLTTPSYLQDSRLLRVTAALAAYNSVPHFVPGPLAEHAATTAPMDAPPRAELTLPATSVLLFHDGVPFSAVADDSDLVEAAGKGLLPLGDEPMVMGGVLTARADGRLEEDLGWLLTAAVDRRSGNPTYSLILVPLGAHPAGRALYGYAALLAFEDWRPPPELPRRDKSGQVSREVKKLARTWQAPRRRVPQGPHAGLHPAAGGTHRAGALRRRCGRARGRHLAARPRPPAGALRDPQRRRPPGRAGVQGARGARGDLRVPALVGTADPDPPGPSAAGPGDGLPAAGSLRPGVRCGRRCGWRRYEEYEGGPHRPTGTVVRAVVERSGVWVSLAFTNVDLRRW